MNVIHRELRSTLKDRRIWVEKTESMNQVYRNRASRNNYFLSVCQIWGVDAVLESQIQRLTDVAHEDRQISATHSQRRTRLFESCEVDQTGPSNVDGSFALDWIHRKVVCWSRSLRRIAWMLVRHRRYHDQAIFIGRAEDDDGVVPNCSLTTSDVSIASRHKKRWDTHCPTSMRMKVLGLCEHHRAWLDIWHLVCVYEPGQYSGPGLLLLEVHLVHRRLFCITPPFSIQMHHYFPSVYRCHVLMGLGKICHWELHHPSNSFHSFQVRTNLKAERSWSAQLGKTSSWKHKASTDRVWMTMQHGTHRECRWCRRGIHEYALNLRHWNTAREHNLQNTLKISMLHKNSASGWMFNWRDMCSLDWSGIIWFLSDASTRPDQYKLPELPILVFVSIALVYRGLIGLSSHVHPIYCPKTEDTRKISLAEVQYTDANDL